MKLGFIKIREVKTPKYGTKDSAGLDFFIPKFTNEFIQYFNNIEQNKKLGISINKDKKLILYPHDRVLIPSGIKLNINKDKNNQNYVGQFINKSGISSKLGLDFLACLIDSDYQGEIHINLVNTGKEIISLKEDQKIAQLVIYPIPNIELIEYKTEKELYKNKESERKEGRFGSTGD